MGRVGHDLDELRLVFLQLDANGEHVLHHLALEGSDGRGAASVQEARYLLGPDVLCDLRNRLSLEVAELALDVLTQVEHGLLEGVLQCGLELLEVLAIAARSGRARGGLQLGELSLECLVRLRPGGRQLALGVCAPPVDLREVLRRTVTQLVEGLGDVGLDHRVVLLHVLRLVLHRLLVRVHPIHRGHHGLVLLPGRDGCPGDEEVVLLLDVLRELLHRSHLCAQHAHFSPQLPVRPYVFRRRRDWWLSDQDHLLGRGERVWAPSCMALRSAHGGLQSRGPKVDVLPGSFLARGPVPPGSATKKKSWERIVLVFLTLYCGNTDLVDRYNHKHVLLS